MIFLGDIQAVPDQSEVIKMHPFVNDMWERVIVFGAFFAVVLGAIARAVFIRKPSRRRRRYHYPKHGASSAPGKNGAEVTSRNGEAEPEKRRRRKRRERPLNPTLAETRGLPPIRKGPPPGP